MGTTRLFAAAILVPLLGTACRTSIVDPVAGSCAPATGEPVTFEFYTFFEPVSYSEHSDPASPGFIRHLG